jgi:hypothetical protein
MTYRPQVADFETRFSLYAELGDWADDARSATSTVL